MAKQRLATLKKAWMALAVVWAVSSVTLLAWSFMSSSFNPGLFAEVYWLLVSLLTPLTFAAFGWDKWKARRESQRTPEKTLYLLSILGGWPGGVMGQAIFRHKTVKPRFRAILAVIVLAHVVPAALWAVNRIFTK